MRSDLLEQRPGATQRWFQGPEGTDLFLWYEGERGATQIQLAFEDRFVEWRQAEGVRTGRLTQFGPLTDQGRMVFDAEPDARTLAMAKAVLRSAYVDDTTLALVRKRFGFSTGAGRRR